MAAIQIAVRALMARVPITAESGATVADALDTMRTHSVQHLLITREGRLAGMLSHRDLLDRVPELTAGDASGQLALLTVDLLMTRRPLSVGPDMPIDQAVSLMSETGMQALPVVDAQNKPLGIVTLRDVASGLLHACAT